MSQAAAVQLAEAVRSAIAGAALSQPVTVERAWTPPAAPPETLDTARVIVIPGPVRQSTDAQTRGALAGGSYEVQIGIQRRTPRREETDAAALLAENIADLLQAATDDPDADAALAGLTDLQYVTGEIAAAGGQTLWSAGIFTSILRATFTIVR